MTCRYHDTCKIYVESDAECAKASRRCPTYRKATKFLKLPEEERAKYILDSRLDVFFNIRDGQLKTIEVKL